MTYPIYTNNLERLTWKQHLLLLDINNRRDRYFYYKVSLFCNSNYYELSNLIKIDILSKLKRDNY